MVPGKSNKTADKIFILFISHLFNIQVKRHAMTAQRFLIESTKL